MAATNTVKPHKTIASGALISTRAIAGLRPTPSTRSSPWPTVLAKECTLAAYAVGFDPYIGFYHQPRFGRPALALDVMEEFRPIIAESAVLTAINNRHLTLDDFITAGRAVNLNTAGRKKFFNVFEQRMTSEITHPDFKYTVCYRRALELQFRILARVLTGEIPAYIPFKNR